MKIKKSTLDDIIKEEVIAMLQEGEGWDTFKRSFVRGLTKGGTSDNPIAQFVGGLALPSEAKEAMEAMVKLEEALKQMRGMADVGPISGSEGKGKRLQSRTAVAARRLASSVSVEGLQKVAGAMRKDLVALFAQLGKDAPESPEEEPESPEEESGEQEAEEEEDTRSAVERAGLHYATNEGLRRRIRTKLRKKGFIS